MTPSDPRTERRTRAAELLILTMAERSQRAWSGDDTMVTPLTSGGLGRTRVVPMWGEDEARRLSFEELTLDRLGQSSPKGHAVASEIVRALIDSLPGGDSRS